MPGDAWILNLDADLELAAVGAYAPKRSVLDAMRASAPKLAASLLGRDDIVIDEGTAPGAARGRRGRAFCPTPRALHLLARSGAEPEPHPSFEVLRAVNSRAFCASLGQPLAPAAFVVDEEEARAMLAASPAPFRRWRVKRAHGMVGRGQRGIEPGALGEADWTFVRAGLAEGGLQIEPEVAIALEYAMHAALAPDGSLRRGSLVEQRCDARGAWLETRRCSSDVAGGIAVGEALASEIERVGAALRREGYFGPFGVDAYTYRLAGGALALQPRSEINARYSMGFALGFGGPCPAWG